VEHWRWRHRTHQQNEEGEFVCALIWYSLTVGCVSMTRLVVTECMEHNNSTGTTIVVTIHQQTSEGKRTRPLRDWAGQNTTRPISPQLQCTLCCAPHTPCLLVCCSVL
jgi:hypothetical protein